MGSPLGRSLGASPPLRESFGAPLFLGGSLRAPHSLAEFQGSPPPLDGSLLAPPPLGRSLGIPPPLVRVPGGATALEKGRQRTQSPSLAWAPTPGALPKTSAPPGALPCASAPPGALPGAMEALPGILASQGAPPRGGDAPSNEGDLKCKNNCSQGPSTDSAPWGSLTCPDRCSAPRESFKVSAPPGNLPRDGNPRGPAMGVNSPRNPPRGNGGPSRDGGFPMGPHRNGGALRDEGDPKVLSRCGDAPRCPPNDASAPK
ncbi:basic salivary proline-rich protein 2-like [Homarus americanus]|uniref:basic salivary proline-rich protein 2-like n=1 Tax=Homarus americanus TaxID=6706 RepID=UPI001C47FAC1|nr:basic salivary proline-rich protein 2-like [Homarus americanus]